MIAHLHLTTEQGFTIARLGNTEVEVAVIPALGAKISSLRALPDGREWMWRPPGPLRLFDCPSADFAKSTLIGADECFPTVRDCRVGGRDLPGHGEVWNLPWVLDETPTDVIRTSLRLPISPFTITRTVSLDRDSVVLTYEILNHSAAQEPFLWALHPLLTFIEGDRLHLPSSVQSVRVELASFPGKIWPWPSPAPEVDLSALRLESDRAAAKFFAGPFDEGWASIENPTTGDRLDFRWSKIENPFLGIWISRGAWSGFHHAAIEPTNAPFDKLSDALDSPTPALFIEANDTKRWRVTICPTFATAAG